MSGLFLTDDFFLLCVPSLHVLVIFEKCFMSGIKVEALKVFISSSTRHIFTFRPFHGAAK